MSALFYRGYPYVPATDIADTSSKDLIYRGVRHDQTPQHSERRPSIVDMRYRGVGYLLLPDGQRILEAIPGLWRKGLCALA